VIDIRNFDAVIFDMDGLLLDSERIIFQCFLEACKTSGIPEQPEVFLAMVGQNFDACQIVLRTQLKGIDDFEAFDKTWDAHAQQANAREGFPLKAGAKEVLAALTARKLPMALATSTHTARARFKLDANNITHHFSYLIGGDQVIKSKPAPDIFLHAAQSLGVAPARCLALEDSKNGAIAALAAGMTTIQIPDLIPHCDELRNAGALRMESLMEFLGYVR
jgi:HAD superfamily hydrolase (TIGR01509 family)